MVEIRKYIHNPYEEARKERLKWLMEFLEVNVPISYGKIIGLIGTRYGVSRATATEYIYVAMQTQDLEQKNGIIQRTTTQTTTPI